MDVQKGDHVLVNAAPFIGSILRCGESIPCEVLDVDGLRVHIRAESPYRNASMWVLSSWIDALPQRKHELVSAV